MRTTKAQISLRIHAVWSAPLLFTAIHAFDMTVGITGATSWENLFMPYASIRTVWSAPLLFPA